MVFSISFKKSNTLNAKFRWRYLGFLFQYYIRILLCAKLFISEGKWLIGSVNGFHDILRSPRSSNVNVGIDY